jgi:hypothetical protein
VGGKFLDREIEEPFSSSGRGRRKRSCERTCLEGAERRKNLGIFPEFKEQLKAIGDTIMTTLNGLTRLWDAFIQTIRGRTKKLKFNSLWEECIQEETRVASREALLARDDDQALDTHTKRGREKPYFQKETHKESQLPNKFNNKESHPRRFKKKGHRRERD